MIGELSGLHYQAYQMAHHMALEAQAAWAYEKAIDMPTYIGNGHWNSATKGLLAGEHLQLSLQQLEKGYMDKNELRLEVTKTISLRQLLGDADFLTQLKTGSLSFNINEANLDEDYAGHYCRQIHTITVSIPAVLGPYQDFHATLQQMSDMVLLKPDPKAIDFLYGLLMPKAGGNGNGKASAALAPAVPEALAGSIRQNYRPQQQVAISTGQNDSGMFSLSFAEGRYLPFEGTGVLSSWQLQLHDLQKKKGPKLNISDVIVRIHYTALHSGGAFEQHVHQKVAAYQEALQPAQAAVHAN